MKRRAVSLHVSDHAVLRYLERAHGLDIDAVRRHLAGLALPAAEVGAIALQVETVKLVFEVGARGTTVVTALPRAVLAPHRQGER